MPRQRKTRGRPPRPLPPRIDASPEAIARAFFASSGEPAAAPVDYRCLDCGKAVNFPDVLHDDGRCAACHDKAPA